MLPNGKIFIQIASYRDPELINTIIDLITKSKYKENLVICIGNQININEDKDCFSHLNKQFEIIGYKKSKNCFLYKQYHLKEGPIIKEIIIPHNESKGACWVRNLIQQKYNNEEYTLQLDSHHRFIKNWDIKLIKWFKYLQTKGHNKPLITAYLPSYNPENDPKERINEPWQMNFDRFIPEGAIFFIPSQIPNWKQLKEPIPSRFYSAHFCFTLGEFSREVQHDPNYYFHGEEISIGVRAYTYGYDLFHLHFPICWHEYTRKLRTKHWDDHKNWNDFNKLSHKRNRILFGMDNEDPNQINFKEYGFGNVRTLEQYEEWSGISFKDRAITKEVIYNINPSNNFDSKIYNTRIEFKNNLEYIFKHYIDIHKSQLLENDYEFLVVAFHDKDDNTLFRKDVDKTEYFYLYQENGDWIKILREFNTKIKPEYYVVWPFSKEKGWCERITGKL